MREVIRQIDLIRVYFENHKEDQFNAIYLADKLEISENTVKQCLARLNKKHIITRISRGFYQYSEISRVPNLRELTKDYLEQIHGLKLISRKEVCNFHHGSHTKVTTVTKSYINNNSKYDQFESQTTLDDHLGPIKKGELTRLNYQGCQITIQNCKTIIEIDIRNSDQPFTIPELDRCIGFLEGYYYPEFNNMNWRVIRFGIGIDIPYTVCKIEGATSISLQQFKGIIKRWYAKNNLKVMRKELHGSIDITIGEFIRDLRGDSPIGVGELLTAAKDNSYAITQLNKQYQEVNSKLDKLIEVLPFLTKDPLCVTW